MLKVKTIILNKGKWIGMLCEYVIWEGRLYFHDMIAVESLRTGDVSVSRHVGRDHKSCDCVWRHRALVEPRSLLIYLRGMQSAFDYARSSEIMFAKCDYKMKVVRFSRKLCGLVQEHF
jgi:hypothetical protein